MAKIRKDLETTSEIPKLDKRVVTKTDGSTYEIDTRNIGSRNALTTIPEKDKPDTPQSCWSCGKTTPKAQRHTELTNGQVITGGEDAANEAAGVEAEETIPADDKLVMALPGEDDTEFVTLALSTSSENSYRLERQPHPCPRCGQDRIVGVNGSKRWCIGCEATWEKERDFLTEVADQSNAPALGSSRKIILPKIKQGEGE